MNFLLFLVVVATIMISPCRADRANFCEILRQNYELTSTLSGAGIGTDSLVHGSMKVKKNEACLNYVILSKYRSAICLKPSHEKFEYEKNKSLAGESKHVISDNPESDSASLKGEAGDPCKTWENQEELCCHLKENLKNEPVELLVVLRPGTDAGALAEEHGLILKSTLRSDPDGHLFEAPSLRTGKEAREALSSHPTVRSVYFNTPAYNVPFP